MLDIILGTLFAISLTITWLILGCAAGVGMKSDWQWSGKTWAQAQENKARVYMLFGCLFLLYRAFIAGSSKFGWKSDSEATKLEAECSLFG